MDDDEWLTREQEQERHEERRGEEAEASALDKEKNAAAQLDHGDDEGSRMT
jgi:hypothetical protein